MDYELIIDKVIEKTKLSKEEIERMIIEKQRELSNLVSKDGAAYIIAKEFGIDMFVKVHRKLQIKNILPGARNLNFEARIVNIYPVKEFERNGQQSKVANIMLGDMSGITRMSLWDEQTHIIDQIEKGMPVQIFGAYAKEDYRGLTEVRLSKTGGLKLLEETEIPEIDKFGDGDNQRITIPELQENRSCELRATLVQLFETGVFYEVCPKCKKRIRKDEGVWKCTEHKEVVPDYAIVLSGVIDDGYGNIRSVFFRDAALSLMGMDMEKALKNKDNIFDVIDALGKEFILTGTIRRNKMFNRLEFVASAVKPIDIETEINSLINNLGEKNN